MRKELDIKSGNQVRLFAAPGKESFLVSKTGLIMDGFGMFATNFPKGFNC